MEKDDIDFVFECFNDIDFWAENPSYGQVSKSRLMGDLFDNPPNWVVVCERKMFVIQKKDGTKIGIAWHLYNAPYWKMEIIGFLIPSERGKGYGTEAAQLMVDSLFLFENFVRIQATVNVGNKASLRILEKAGFQREGTIRKFLFVKGVWTDYHLLSILREEWKEPKILTKTTSETWSSFNTNT